jgi:hypothetical protein
MDWGNGKCDFHAAFPRGEETYPPRPSSNGNSNVHTAFFFDKPAVPPPYDEEETLLFLISMWLQKQGNCTLKIQRRSTLIVVVPVALVSL